MQSLSTTVVATALFLAAVNAQFQINTPASLTECVPTQFTWTGGQEPFFLAINPGGVTGASALQQYSGITGNSFTWSTNITAGTSIGLELTDTNGQIAQSAPVTIQSGPSTSCLNGQTSAASGGASTTAAGTTGASTGNSGTSTTAAASGTTKAATSGTGAGSASGSKTSGSAASTSTAASGSSGSNGALSNVASAGVVGVVGVVAAALLA